MEKTWEGTLKTKHIENNTWFKQSANADPAEKI